MHLKTILNRVTNYKSFVFGKITWLEDDASHERRNQLRHPAYAKPELLATAVNQVWSWDITKHRESADLASRLIRESVEKQQVSEDQLILHSDRGPSMGSHNVAQLLATLGVTKSHSRPHVSNDNPFSESQFKTIKHCPEFPNRFDSFDEALCFCRTFFGWYNDEHRHSALGLMTPGMVHWGQAPLIRRQRQVVLDAAYRDHPERFVRKPPRAPDLQQAVWINKPPDSEQKSH